MKRKDDIVFDSMAALHGVTGLPLSEIKRAKKTGCKAFMAENRISLCALLLWLNGVGRRKNTHVVDVNAAKERALLARAKLDEQKYQKESRELVTLDYFNRLQREFCLPIRQALFAMPSQIAHLANPQDPPTARRACQDWLDANLALMQEAVEKKAKQIGKESKGEIET